MKSAEHMDKAALKEQLTETVEHLEEEFKTLRTGRAHPGLVESIPVMAYGSPSVVKNVASVTITDPRTITVEAWDKGLTSALEKAIRESGQGLNPVSDGAKLRIPVPQPTEESRRDMVKIMKKMVEEARIRVRRIRDDAKQYIINREKNKDISEDDRYRWQDDLEAEVKMYNQKIEEAAEAKESEIMKV